MQNLDWNKCFQRVSDAGLHFPLLFLVAGWHVFVFLFSADHPGRLDENGYPLCLGGSLQSSRARSLGNHPNPVMPRALTGEVKE